MGRILKYGDFILENMDMAKSIVKKKMEEFEKLKNLLSKNLGYMGKFTEYLFKESVPYDELDRVYNDLIELKSKSKNLNINNYSFEELVDEIQRNYEDIGIWNVVKQFPKEQKKLINKYLQIDKDVRNMLYKISKKDNIRNFTSKISRYHTEDDLIKAIKIFSKDPDNNRDVVKKKLEKIKSKVVFEDSDLLIVHVDSCADLQILGSDTSWCILSEYMWKSYNSGHNRQFIIYDYRLAEYDTKFKIGITLKGDGSIKASHDILDGYIGDSEIEKILSDKITTSEIYNKTVTVKPNEFKEGEKVRFINYRGIPQEGIVKDSRDDMVMVSGIWKEANTLFKMPKLNKSTSNRVWVVVSKYLTKEECLKWSKEFLTWGKTDSSEGTVITNLLENAFKNDKYVNIKDIDEELQRYSKSITNVFNPDKFEIKINKHFIQALKDGFWSDQVISQMNSYWVLREIFDEKGGEAIPNFNNDDLKAVFDKLNSVYNKDYTYETKRKHGWREMKKGVKYSSVYESLLILLSKVLKIEPTGELKKNHDKILNNKNVAPTIRTYYKTFEKPIDLDRDGISNVNQVKYVIKKDYKDPLNIYFHPKGVDPWSTRNRSEVYERLINHLKEHKLTFNITIESLRKGYRSHRSYFKCELLRDILDEMIKNKSNVGDSITKENVTVNIIEY